LSELFTLISGTGWMVLGIVIPFLFVLTVVVFVHEMGHYLVGRWCGIGAQAFSIGFGPELIGFTDRNGTRWKISAIPLGGYVKFVGDMNVTSTPDSEAEADLSEEERRMAFHTQPVWKRALTVFAGPAFNFLLTIVVFTALFSIYGVTVTEPVVAKVTPGSPAERAGFLAGDRFVSVDGKPVQTFDDVRWIVSGRGGDSVDFVMMRDGREVPLEAVPEMTVLKDADGKPLKDEMGRDVRIAAIGVQTSADVGQPRHVKFSAGEALVESVEQTGAFIVRTGQFFKRLVVGREDVCQLGGPVRIAKMSEKAAKDGFEWVVYLVAMLSVGIGFLNLLPIPPLDGGHLAFYAYEAVFRRPASERVMDAVYRTGLVLVLGFMVFVFASDAFNPLGC
jgi:regulator of sigma E protease